VTELLAEIEQIFRDVLGDEEFEISPETTPATLPGWDSLAHVNVLFSVEETFGVQFSTSEFGRLATVQDLADALVAKGAAAPDSG
jgi:acyl carrier protein